MVVTKNRTVTASNEEKSSKNIENSFEEFSQAQDSSEILISFQKLKAAVGGEHCENGKEFYATLKSKLQSWKCKSLWEVLDARAKHKEYGNGKVCEDLQVLVIGSGPIGLRTAIEIALLGAKVIIVEKRTTFGRNNVLHLWPFLIQDFRSVGAKRFYGKFCSGTLDHISIRILQCMLMKTALVLGVQIYTGVTFEKMIEPTSGDNGWRCSLNPPFHPASQVDVDAVIGADGKKNVLPDFPQIEMRGSLAIGITLNLVYRGTKQEAAISEISGLAYHFKPQFFDTLFQKYGVRLENFVYYKNETHYFVMTAVKSSLLTRGVLLMDYANPTELLSRNNVDVEKLKAYAMDAVNYGTGGQLTNPEFELNDRGKSDIAVFDFTSLKKAEHAARIVERKGHRLLMALVGDSLIEPFWPTGSGCARGVLSALDTAWMLRSFAIDKPPLQVLGERESVYKLLSATSVNNLRKKYEDYTINPFSRYVEVNLKKVKEVYHLYDSDDPVNADFRVSSPSAVGAFIDNTKRRISVSNQNRQVKTFKNRRKSSYDGLDDKKDAKNKKTKENRRRRASRDSDEILGDNPSQGKRKMSKAGKSLKKQQTRQSSESADEDVQTRRQRKMSRTKSRDRKMSEDNLDAITESPKTTKKSGNKEVDDLNMKERSTKRWRLFGGTKPKLKSVDKDEGFGVENDPKSKQDKKQAPSNKVATKNVLNEVAKSTEKTEMKKGGGKTPIRQKQGSLKGISSPRNNKENASPKTVVFRKPSDTRPARAEPFNRGSTRSASYIPALHSTPQKTTPQLKRPNSEIKDRASRFGSLRSAKDEAVINDAPSTKKLKAADELSRKNSKNVNLPGKKSKESVFNNLESLSPAAQRTAPVLLTLTPEKKDKKYSEGGAVTIVAGIAAMVALTTPLAVEEQQPFKEFQMKRQKILSGSRTTVSDRVISQNSPASNKKFRRDLTAALDNADGSPKPVKRFFSFSSAQRNVKQKLDFEKQKSTTLPKKEFGRHSLKSDLRSFHSDIPSILDNTMSDLIKHYKFNEIHNTLKLMLDIFRHISKDPEAELPRRVATDGDTFRVLVWSIKEAKLFMVVSGWIEVGNFILLPKPRPVFEPIRVLMQNYRMLCEQQALDISCPLPSVKLRRVSDEVFRPHEIRRTSSGIQCADIAKDDGKDTGSHSSDSGMGFSETASLNNVAAVISAKTTDDVITNGHNDVISTAANGAKYARSASVVMDPKMYLESSNETAIHNVRVDPCKYTRDTTDESVAGEQNVRNPGTTEEHWKGLEPKRGILLSLKEKCLSPILKNGKNRGVSFKDFEESSLNDVKERDWEILHESLSNTTASDEMRYSPLNDAISPRNQTNLTYSSSGDVKQHNWEILGQNSSDSRVYEDVDYSQDITVDKIQNDFRDASLEEAKGLSNTLDELLKSMEEPMDYNEPELTPQEHLYPEVFIGDQPVAEQRAGTGHKKNELDDLFDTLDFVTEQLQPMRVVCNEKPKNEPKKSRLYPKSTETSRRREEFARSKMMTASEERASPKPKRKTRNNENARTRQNITMETTDVDMNSTQRRIMPNRAAKTGNYKNADKKESNYKETAVEVAAVPSTSGSSGSDEVPLQLRRSRRIAESSGRGRKAKLTLETSSTIEESSTDLDKAFVVSGLEESREVRGNGNKSRDEKNVSHENGNVSRESAQANKKRRVRRKSSIVKTKKPRMRAKHAGYK